MLVCDFTRHARLSTATRTPCDKVGPNTNFSLPYQFLTLCGFCIRGPVQAATKDNAEEDAARKTSPSYGAI